VAQQKSQLYGQAQTATDPSAVSQQALGAAAGISTPSTFAPLGQLFNNFSTQYLAASSAPGYNLYAQQYLNQLTNPSIYGGNTFL
jgi:hypothetical protein